MSEVDPHQVPDPAELPPQNTGPRRLSSPILAVQNRDRNWEADATHEKKLFIVAILAFLLPFGFALAVWPLVSGRGRAWNLALISIPINIFAWIIIVFALFFRMPNC